MKGTGLVREDKGQTFKHSKGVILVYLNNPAILVKKKKKVGQGILSSVYWTPAKALKEVLPSQPLLLC